MCRDCELDEIKRTFGKPPYYFLTYNIHIPYHQFGIPDYIDNNGVEYKQSDLAPNMFAYRLPSKEEPPMIGWIYLRSYDSKEWNRVFFNDVEIINKKIGIAQFL